MRESYALPVVLRLVWFHVNNHVQSRGDMTSEFVASDNRILSGSGRKHRKFMNFRATSAREWNNEIPMSYFLARHMHATCMHKEIENSMNF